MLPIEHGEIEPGADVDDDSPPGPKRSRRLARLIGLGVLALIGLSLWPPQRPTAAESTEAAARYHGKLSMLEQAAVTGQAARREVSQDEINARLAELMAANREARRSRGLTVGIEGFAASAREGHLALFVETRLAGLPLVFEARLGPSPGDGERPLVLRSLWVGRLPILGPFRDLVASRMRSMFRRVEPESSLLPRIDAAVYREGEVEMSIAAREG